MSEVGGVASKERAGLLTERERCIRFDDTMNKLGKASYCCWFQITHCSGGRALPALDGILGRSISHKIVTAHIKSSQRFLGMSHFKVVSDLSLNGF